MTTAIATIFGIIALFGQGYDLPDKFVDGAIERGTPVIEAKFVGLEWDCADETCWSGIAKDNGEWFLHTGP